MRELTYYVAVSLDGYIASPDHAFDAFDVEGDHIDLILKEYVDTLPAAGLEALGLKADRSRFDTVLMGWNTYAVGFPYGVYDPYPHLRQYVFSRRHTKADGNLDAAGEIMVTAEDPVSVVRRLKAEPEGTGIWLCGGGQLASTLIDEIDRLVLKVNPVLFGDGIRLFATRPYDPRRFELTGSRTFRTGVVMNEYRRAA